VEAQRIKDLERENRELRRANEILKAELVVDEPDGGRHRVVGRLQPPLLRHGRLRDIEFGLRELEPRQ
jgi:hypothetical protein